MFDLSADPARRAVRHASIGSSIAAIAAHLAGLTVLIAIPVSRAVRVDSTPPSIPAFVVASEPLQEPGPPPALRSRPKRRATSAIDPPAPAIDAPPGITPESTTAAPLENADEVDGGVEDGAAVGVVGGVGTGLAATVVAVARAPESAPTRVPAPLRVSGAITAPDLLHRVDPVYSPIAAASHVSGIVILQAAIDVDGSVASVQIVRSGNPLLDKAAADALKQWKYAPLLLAGTPTPFVVVATFNFRYPGVGTSIGAAGLRP